jgi:hypothetical protein
MSQGLHSFVWPYPNTRWQRCRGMAGGYSWCSRTGGPSTCCSAHSTKRKDKHSPSGGLTEALLAGRPPLPNREEPSASPLAGRRQRQPLPGLQIARAVASLLQSWGHQWHGKGMAKARVARVTELLEDVVRFSRPASSEALPWQHLFVLSHFLEGV